MMGIPFQGSDEDARLVQAIREGRPPYAVASDFDTSQEELVRVYQEYLRQRIARGRSLGSLREIHEGHLDYFDALVERFWPSAAAGNVTAARVIMTALTSRAALEKQYFGAEIMLAGRSESSDAMKSTEGVLEPTSQAAFAELERLYREYDLPVPPSVVRAYQETLLAEVEE